MIKTASEQLLDHPLVSFLEEAGLEPVGVYSEGVEKTAAFTLLSGIQITPNKFDMRAGTRGYLPFERARLPHRDQRVALNRINRMIQGPQFSGTLSPFNAALSQDRRYMNNFMKMSSVVGGEKLKKASSTAQVFDGPNLAAPSTLMQSLGPSQGPLTIKKTRKPKKVAKLRAQPKATQVKVASGIRAVLLRKLAEASPPPAPEVVRRGEASGAAVKASSPPTKHVLEVTSKNLKKAVPQIAAVKPIDGTPGKGRKKLTIKVNQKPVGPGNTIAGFQPVKMQNTSVLKKRPGTNTLGNIAT